MNTILEALKELKNLEEDAILNEEIDPDLFANYVDSIQIFNSVLDKQQILANYKQWKKHGKDFDTRGNHICLTNDIINPPRIMPSLQFGIAFDREELLKDLETKALKGDIIRSTEFVRDSGKQVPELITNHEDSRFRRFAKEKINGKKNTIMGMYITSLIECENGVKFIGFKAWTLRPFPVKGRRQDDELLSENDFIACDKLWDKLWQSFELAYKLNQSDKDPKKIKIHKLDKSNPEVDLDYPNFKNNSLNAKRAFIVGENIDLGSTKGINPLWIKEKYCLELHSSVGLDGEDSTRLTYDGKELPISEPLDAFDMLLLDEYILNEHEFRVYLKDTELNKDAIEDENKSSIGYNDDVNKGGVGVLDDDKYYKHPETKWFKFENTSCIKRIMLPDYAIVSEGTSSQKIALYKVYKTYKGVNSITTTREELKNIIINIYGLRTKAGIRNVSLLLDALLELGCTYSEIYAAFHYCNYAQIIYWDHFKTYYDKWKATGNFTPANTIKRIVKAINEVVKLRDIIQQKYSKAEIKWYKNYIDDFGIQTTEYVDVDDTSIYNL